VKRETIHGGNRYDIPCINQLTGAEKMAVIISHGLGSSKESPTAKAVLDALSRRGIGAFSFDFPAHGDSLVDGRTFRVENCISDLGAVEAHARKLCPDAEIAYFSSSFGAYINLIYLSTRKHAGNKSFLRCAAVDMPGILRRDVPPERGKLLETQGYIVLDGGYVRPLTMTRGFINDLETHDVFALYRPGTAELAMIHGTADETAPIGDARRFAHMAGAHLTEVEGADHRFLIPGGMERVVQTAVDFFTARTVSEPIRVKKLAQPEIPEALSLVWNVFLKFEAPEYSKEGIENFKSFIDSEKMIGGLMIYGAFLEERLVGVAATREQGNHIALFFVDGRYHRRGIGRKLFETVLRHSSGDRITVNSSPYALPVYRRLGFFDADSERVVNGIRYIPMTYQKQRERGLPQRDMPR